MTYDMTLHNSLYNVELVTYDYLLRKSAIFKSYEGHFSLQWREEDTE